MSEVCGQDVVLAEQNFKELKAQAAALRKEAMVVERKKAKQEEEAAIAQVVCYMASETPKFVTRDWAMCILAHKKPTPLCRRHGRGGLPDECADFVAEGVRIHKFVAYLVRRRPRESDEERPQSGGAPTRHHVFRLGANGEVDAGMGKPIQAAFARPW